MKTFKVYKNGSVANRTEWMRFLEVHLLGQGEVLNFKFNWEYAKTTGISDEDLLESMETDLFIESELDRYSMDWEFIDVTN